MHFIAHGQNHEGSTFTPFNGRNFVRCVDSQVVQGRMPLSFATMDTCHKWLDENHYYQLPDRKRSRNDAPPREFPAYVAPPTSEQEQAVILKTAQEVEARNLEEKAAAKALPFDQLKSQATAGYRTE